MDAKLDGLHRKLRDIKATIKTQRKRVEYYEATATYVSLFYILFETIIFFLLCQWPPTASRWIPFCFASSVAVFMLPTIMSSMMKWADIHHHYDLSFVMQDLVHHRIVCLQTTDITDSSKASSSWQIADDDRNHPLTADSSQVRKRYAGILGTFSMLVASTSLVLYACYSLPSEGRMYFKS